MLDDNKIVECCDELLVRGIMSRTEGSVREIAQERAVRACAIHAISRGLGLKEAAADLAAQLRNARAERYCKGREERRGDLWECGAGGIEQALWVQKQEQHMSDCFQQIFQEQRRRQTRSPTWRARRRTLQSSSHKRNGNYSKRVILQRRTNQRDRQVAERSREPRCTAATMTSVEAL